MSGDEKTQNIPRKKLIIIILIVALLILTALVTIPRLLGGGNGFFNLSGLFSRDTETIIANEFSFGVGRDRAFAHLGGSVAAVGSLGVQVLDAEGFESLRESFHMSEPAISQAGEYAIAFDIGSTAVRVFSATEVIAYIETSGAIVSASINENGWFCIVTQEGHGSLGTVRVYNNSGLEIYTVTLGSGYPISALLSRNNNTLAILNLTPYGSRISIYDGLYADKSEPDFVFNFVDGLIFDMFFLTNGYILALSTNSVIIIDNNGVGDSIFTFYGNRLGGYTFNENFIALHLYDYGLGYSGRLVTLQIDGTVLGERITGRDIISMASSDNYLMILQTTGLSFLDMTLNELTIPEYADFAVGANRILALEDSVALATNDHSALVIRLQQHAEEEIY